MGRMSFHLFRKWHKVFFTQVSGLGLNYRAVLRAIAATIAIFRRERREFSSLRAAGDRKRGPARETSLSEPRQKQCCQRVKSYAICASRWVSH